MIPGCVIGVGAAWLLAAYVSDGVIRLVVGLIALGLVSYTFLRHRLPGETARPAPRTACSGVRCRVSPRR
jgi:uncharacterized membrane protein YfcA